jgi:Protein of unknown function (DUF1566)
VLYQEVFMVASRFSHNGRPAAALAFGAALMALLLALLLAGTALAATPGKPTAKAPTGTISTTKPTFKWSKAAHATSYEIRAYQGTTLLVKKTGIATLSWKSSKALPRNVDLTWKVRARNAAAGAWSTSVGFKVALAIGNAYQGGKVAYVFKSGDPGYVAGQTHGLIAAKADQSTGIQWYKGSYTTTGATGTALGTGSANTNMIIRIQGTPAASYAAGVARASSGGGHADWYLPSKDELNKLYLHQAAIGGFGPHYYWSSSEYDALSAWNQAFDLSSQYANPKSSPSYVRAVRTF